MIYRLGSRLLLSIFILSSPAGAVDLGSKVELHGYGSVIYGETDGHQFATGDADGEFDNLDFALNATFNLHPRFRLVTQVAGSRSSLTDGTDVELDYLFGAWQYASAHEVQFGRVKQPFGIYTEIFDVGTVRPFLLLPQGLYGPTAIVSKSFDGVGLTGGFRWHRWGLEYNLYGGELLTEGSIPQIQQLLLNPMSPLATQVDSTFEFDISDVVGARLNLLLPVTGWTLGASAYVGDSQASGLAAPISGDVTAYGIHSEYLTDRWSVRAEYAFLDADLAEQDTAYLELARRLGEHWQVGVRWEDAEAIPDFAALLSMLPLPPGLPPGLPPSGFPPGLPPGGPVLPPFANRFFEHRDVVVGVNYWFAEAYVLKVNFHQVTGNRLAVPASAEALQDLNRGILDDSTELIEVGFQFSF